MRVFDHDCQEGRLYLVMELVEGATLRQAIEGERRDLAWTLDKIAQLADVLQVAHEHGIVHRDIKPENVMVDTTGRVRGLDFGISHALADGERLTRTGEILGTPEYMAPEQILDVPEAVDARTDVYSTGVVLYELLTGRSPFAGNNLFQVLKNVEALEPEPPSHLRAGIPPALVGCVRSWSHKSPALRPARGVAAPQLVHQQAVSSQLLASEPHDSTTYATNFGHTPLDALVMECLAKDKEQRPAQSRTVARRMRELQPAAASPRPVPRTARFVVALVVCLAMGVVVGRFLRTGDGAVSAPALATPAAAIEHMVAGSRPFDREALAAAAAAIPDRASPDVLFWRGLARQRLGALLGAERDLATAHAAGVRGAGVPAAIAWLLCHRLLPRMVAGGEVLCAPHELRLQAGVDADLELALQAMAKNEFEAASAAFARIAVPDDDVLVLESVCALAGSTIRTSRVAPSDTDHVASRILAAVRVPGPDRMIALEAILSDVDRTVPLRYVLEAAIAAGAGDEPRGRAALELARVVGDGELALSVYLAGRLAAPTLPAAELPTLRELATELRDPAAAPLQRLVKERCGGG
ncbi:MAG: serine/threonine protein kinase [Planctomycetes bacterium]|nr:serine/threonine protein kinase [Planctomycetota bacterium]